MKTFKIVLSDKWRYSPPIFITANSHASAITEVQTTTKRINNQRFREIETTGKFYFVEEVCKGGKTFIFEVN